MLPLIGAAIGLAGNAIGAGIQSSLNNKAFNKNKEFYWEQYERQRSDALADWNMQNQYNSPEAQMRRFKEAGLNPNLIYGQQSNSPSVRSTSAQQGNLAPVQVETGAIGDAINQYMNVQRVQSEIKVNNERAKNIAADTYNKLPENEVMRTLLNNKKASTFKQEVEGNILDEQHKSGVLLATKNQILQNLKVEEQVKASNILVNIEKALLTKVNQSKSYADVKKTAATINLLRSQATQAEIDAGLQLFGMKFGTYGKSKGILYNNKEMKNIDAIMDELDSNWKNYSNKQRNNIINNINQY